MYIRLNAETAKAKIATFKVLCLVFSLAIFQSVHAQDGDNDVVGSVLASPDLCGKQAMPLPNGNRHGAVKSNRSSFTYSGPSVVCKIAGKLDSNSEFIVMGTSKSAFGKPWYQLKLMQDDQRVWVPKKYVILGKPAKELSYKTISQAVKIASIDLNVRSCPDTTCDLVGSLIKGEKYNVRKIAENGWLEVALPNNDAGWASGRYLATPTNRVNEEISMVREEANAEPTSPSTREPAVINSTPKPKQVKKKEKPKIDPCRYDAEFTAYESRYVWRIKEAQDFVLAPHAQCAKSYTLQKGRALITIGEMDSYYVVVFEVNKLMKAGYLLKDLFKEQYVGDISFPVTWDAYSDDALSLLKDREEYWTSFEYKLGLVVDKMRNFVDRNKKLSLCFLAMFLGVLMLILKRTRRKMLRADQILLRTGYFTIRSNEFWGMMRRLCFIVILGVAMLVALAFYVMWLKEIGDLRQQIMGGSSLALMSLSVGWFGARVAGFFTGVMLFTLSLVEFLMFVWLLCFLFLLPSLILLLVYYIHYRRKRLGADSYTAPFNNEEIESIHEKVFRLRNFYPETVINWARKGGVKERWNNFKDVAKAKSNIFDEFFSSVNKKQRVV